MGNVSGAGRPGCSTTIVITPPTYPPPLYQQLPLSDRERGIIQRSWTYSEQSALLNCGQRLVHKVLRLAPETTKLFRWEGEQYNCSYYKHVRAVMNLMEFAISRIDQPDAGENLWRACFEIGRRHGPLRDRGGFKEEYWMTFKVAMLQCAIEWEGTQCNRRSIQTWSKFLTYMVNQMKSGYEYEVLAKGRSLSVPNV